MTDQLAITGTGVPTPPELKLTPRQRFALECLGARPMTSEELGAILHEMRRGDGGRGHAADARCDYCRPEGSQMGDRLRRDGLVKFSRKLGIWYVVALGLPKKPQSAARGEIPF